MTSRARELTREDKDVLNALLLDFATELDLHYEESDLHALSSSFSKIKAAVALLKRVGSEPHPDVVRILARFDRANQ